MKKRLLKLLQKKEARKQELGEKASAATEVTELRSINTELDVLNGEITELRGMIDELPDEEVQIEDPKTEGNQRSQPVGGAQVIASYGLGQNQREQRSIDPLDTVEYRTAFMDYVRTGQQSEDLEFRVDATTGTGDLGAVIPSTILNKIIEKMKDYGHIWSRVTKTSIQGGVQIPISNAKPTAVWVSAGSMADKEKKTTSGSVTFAYHKLQVRVAVELVAGTVAMPIFEQTVSDNIYEAMIIALEEAIISGSGTGQPLGIIKDTDIPATQIIEVDPTTLNKYDTWTELLAKVPRKYRNRASIILNDADWNKYIVGMTDANGQLIARTTYGLDGIQQEKFLGKEVLPIEDYLPSVDDADAGEVFGVIVNLSDYMVNSNMQMTFKKYFNEDTDEWISKSTMICDGELADKNGVVILKKPTI